MDENMKYSKVVIGLLESWEQSRIVYCHWKSIEHLDATYQAKTDIDVLVGREDAAKAIEEALKTGFVEVTSSHFRGYPAVRDFICYDDELDNWVHLHFHTQLSCGDRWVKAYHLPFEKFILESRVWLESYKTWIIAPSYELLVLIYRMNAKFRKNWLKDDRILAEIKFINKKHERYPVQIGNEIMDYVDRDKWWLYEALLHGNISVVNISFLRKGFRISEFRRMTSGRFFFFSKLRYLYRIYSEVRRRFFEIYKSGRRTFPGGGYVVAFVGIDGSGKSSGIERITKFFAKQMNVQTNFLGSGKSGAGLIRKLIMNIVGFKASSKGHKEVRKAGGNENVAKSDLPRPPLHYVLWIMLCTLDREKQLKKIQYGLGNGNLVFVDRWLQDDRLDSVDAPRLANYKKFKGIVGYVARREAKLYKKIKLIPLHLVIKLNIDAETSIKRKPGELSYTQASDAIEKLNILKWPKEAKIMEIDGTDSLQNVTVNLKKAIFQLLQEK